MESIRLTAKSSELAHRLLDGCVPRVRGIRIEGDAVEIEIIVEPLNLNRESVDMSELATGINPKPPLVVRRATNSLDWFRAWLAGNERPDSIREEIPQGGPRWPPFE